MTSYWSPCNSGPVRRGGGGGVRGVRSKPPPPPPPPSPLARPSPPSVKPLLLFKLDRKRRHVKDSVVAIRSKAISPCKYFRHCTDHIDNIHLIRLKVQRLCQRAWPLTYSLYRTLNLIACLCALTWRGLTLCLK